MDARNDGAQQCAPEPVTLLAVTCHVNLVVLFLGQIHGLWVHWYQGRSVYCPGAEQCPASVHRRKRLWKGYAAVYLWDPKRALWLPRVLEVTESLGDHLRDREMRGEVWVLGRKDPKARTSAVIGRQLQTRDVSTLRPPFDIRPVLARVFSCDLVVLDADHPRPPVVMLEPARDTPPPEDRKQGTESTQAAPAQTWKRLRAEAAAGELGNGKRLKARP
jgi:hypothetical protein